MSTHWHWLCLTCLKHGDYDEPDTKTDTGEAAKHLRACPGATTTATQTGVIERLREWVTAG